VNPETAERLRRLEIQLAADTRSHSLFVRGETLALVERVGEGFGAIGSTGLSTERGVAYLVWRQGRAMLAAKGGEVPARPEQVAAILRFSEDLKSALGQPGGPAPELRSG
jgi:hypothetical protein